MNLHSMPTVLLALGRPRFYDPDLRATAATQGPSAAWAALLGPALSGQADAKDALLAVGGEFAVAAQGADGTLLLAVDRFAMQTLCFRHEGDRLRFAPTADALADAGATLNLQALFDYLYFHAIPSPGTVFAGVQRLPAGHCLIHRQGQAVVARYWQPQFQAGTEASFAPLRLQFLAALETAVADELDGSKAACFLSGGTDSSSVAGMLSKLSEHGVDTYSIGFAAQGYDEMAYARLAARHFGTRHHEYYVTPDDLLHHIPRVAAHYDQPFGNSSALPAFCCAQFARGDGVTRLLAGDGGDELYGGNARYATQRVFGWYQNVPRMLRRLALEPALASPLAGATALTRKARSYVAQARTPMPDRLQQYNLLMRLGPAQVLTARFLATVDAQHPVQHQRDVWAANTADAELNTTLAYDWRYTLAESDLPKVRDTCRLAGVSVGFPMLHEALVDLSLRLPVDYKLKGLKLRWFFKEALRGFLPDAILTKSKHGFGLPFGIWATSHDGLRAMAQDSLRGLVDRGVVRPEFVKALLDTHLRSAPSYYGEMVWILMMLEQWLRSHAPGFRVADS
jgi:asparagine synthase (glutamine-hydrolysing)